MTGNSGFEHLLRTARRVAREGRWQPLVRPTFGERWHVLLHRSTELEVWLLGWGEERGVEMHDHGGASGAYVVVEGTLVETSRQQHGAGPLKRQVLRPGDSQVVPADTVHDVRSVSTNQAVSIHCYSPVLFSMNFYRTAADGSLLRSHTELADSNEQPIWRQPFSIRTIDDVLVEARTRLQRMTPADAATAIDNGAILVDIRPEGQRKSEGMIPGALTIERNVLEWRLDPLSTARIAEATDHEVEYIIICSEGYTSSLAAAALHDLGLHRATDVIGGVSAWIAAGLPVQRQEEQLCRAS